MRKNILVLCTGNSCRSQIAHGFLAKFPNEKANIYSAGIETHGVNPKAIQVMKEIGIDISNHTSNHIDEYKNIDFDFVITVCDHAQEVCPYFPSNAVLLHQNFTDPAKAKGDSEAVMNVFRNVRSEIETYCKNFLNQHNLL